MVGRQKFLRHPQARGSEEGEAALVVRTLTSEGVEGRLRASRAEPLRRGRMARISPRKNYENTRLIMVAEYGIIHGRWDSSRVRAAPAAAKSKPLISLAVSTTPIIPRCRSNSKRNNNYLFSFSRLLLVVDLR